MKLFDRVRNSSLANVSNEVEVRTPMNVTSAGENPDGLKILGVDFYLLIGDAKEVEETETVEA